MRTIWLGQVDYRAAWELQRELAALRADGSINDLLLLLEHPRTITLGRGFHAENLLHSPESLAASGVALVETYRGGDVTYHAPGQLVGYPIVSLAERGKDVHAYLRDVEGCIIAALGDLGLEARRLPPHTGVWVGDRKVCAIGIKVSRWVTMHGFALNVCPDLRGFAMIIPCGIRDKGVTSLTIELGRLVSPRHLVHFMSARFTEQFSQSSSAAFPPRAGLSDKMRKLLISGVDSGGEPVLSCLAVAPPGA